MANIRANKTGDAVRAAAVLPTVGRISPAFTMARGGLTTEDRRQMDALGLHDLTADELRAARLRWERFEAPSSAAEVNRLEMKLQEINAAKNERLASDCHKAIAQLRVFVRLEQAQLNLAVA